MGVVVRSFVVRLVRIVVCIVFFFLGFFVLLNREECDSMFV